MFDWYLDYFCKEYWDFAQHEYKKERTLVEVEYLSKIFKIYNAKVIGDFGCGIGRHSIELLRKNYSVNGLDISHWALSQFKKKLASLSLTATLHQVDLLRIPSIPGTIFDAAFLIQSFGWGSDFQQESLLKKIREKLIPYGILILDVTNPIWIFKNYIPKAEIKIDDLTFQFNRHLYLKELRSQGTLTILNNESKKILYHDIKLYMIHEIIKMVNMAGFDIVRIDSDFDINNSIIEDARYYQIVAQKRNDIKQSLAIASHLKLSSTVQNQIQFDGDNILDLRTSPDEESVQLIDIHKAWEDLIRENDFNWKKVRDYSLNDPYYKEATYKTINDFYNVNLNQENIFWVAGITNAIYQLSQNLSYAKLLTSIYNYPDMRTWFINKGANICIEEFKNNTRLELIRESVKKNDPDVIHIENPDIFGNKITESFYIDIISNYTKQGKIIIIDESNMNYYPIEESIINKVSKTDNLIVLKGFSKGYVAGGLRIGIVLCSSNLSSNLQQLIPPLQVSMASLKMAIRLLLLGDIFSQDKSFLFKTKSQIISKLQEKNVPLIDSQNPIPWVIIEDVQNIWEERLKSVGILSKVHIELPNYTKLLKLCVPLSQNRIELFNKLIKNI